MRSAGRPAAAASIHPTAIIEPGATIGAGVTIGPYCTIGPNAVIGDDCRLVAHVHVQGHTTVGARTIVYPFASLGVPPQSVHYRGGPTRLVIGTDCDIREGVTMNTGTEDGRGVTEVGDHGFFMVNSHVAHDCSVGSNVTFANGATLGGHCVIGDHVFIGGLAAVHQYTRIGESAMIAGTAGLNLDVIPFALVAGPYGRLRGINAVGLKRRNFPAQSIRAVRAAYRRIFLGGGEMAQRLADVEAEYGGDSAVMKIVSFIRNKGKRELCPARNGRSEDDE
jgi:UDP-N-acetylglucosamine acyltransferase